MRLSLLGTTFHVLELPILLILVFLFVFYVSKNGLSIFHQAHSEIIFILSLLFYLITILISGIDAYSVSLVLKSLVKWLEAFVVILMLFYVLSKKTVFRFFYWILFAGVFMFILETIIRVAIGEYVLFAFRIFPAYESAFSIALLLPFIDSKNKTSAITLLAVCLFSAILSLSRGTWLAIMFLTGYSTLVLGKRFRKHVFMFTTAVIIMALIIPQSRQLLVLRFSQMFEKTQISNRVRTNLLNVAFNAYLENPVNGVGSLNFPRYMVDEGHLTGIHSKNYAILSPHNTFVQVAAEEGTLGLIAFLFMLFNFYHLLFIKNRLELFDDDFKPYIVGVRLFSIVMLMNLMFAFIASEFRLYLSIMMGLTVGMSHFRNDLKEKSINR